MGCYGGMASSPAAMTEMPIVEPWLRWAANSCGRLQRSVPIRMDSHSVSPQRSRCRSPPGSVSCRRVCGRPARCWPIPGFHLYYFGRRHMSAWLPSLNLKEATNPAGKPDMSQKKMSISCRFFTAEARAGLVSVAEQRFPQRYSPVTQFECKKAS